MRVAKQLSVKQVEALKKDGTYAVGGVSGLYLYVNGKNSRLWILRFTDPNTGKRTSFSIGSCSLITLAQARESALAALDLIRKGINPSEARKAEKAKRRENAVKNITFEQLANELIEKRVEVGYYSQNEFGEYKARLLLRKHICPHIGKRKIRDITPDHLVAVFLPFWRGSESSFAKIKSLVSDVFKAAIARRLIKTNPCDFKGALGILMQEHGKRMPKRENLGALRVDEIAEFMTEAVGIGSTDTLALAFAILTTSRSKMVRLMTWREVDFQARKWVIPSERMKVKGMAAHVVYLSDQAIEILRSMEQGEPNDYIFKSPRTNAPYCPELMPLAVRKINASRGIRGLPPWIDRDQTESRGETVPVTQHGISRATFKTWTKSLGNWKRFSETAVEMCLAHKTENYGGAYDRAEMENERREIMQAWADFILPKNILEKV